MGQYDKLDEFIVSAIDRGFNTFDSLHREHCVSSEASRLGERTGSVDWRIVDRRVQALRKRGRIWFFAHRWHVIDAQEK